MWLDLTITTVYLFFYVYLVSLQAQNEAESGVLTLGVPGVGDLCVVDLVARGGLVDIPIGCLGQHV